MIFFARQPGLGGFGNRTAQMYRPLRYIRRAGRCNHDALSARTRGSACLPPAGAAAVPSADGLPGVPGFPIHRRLQRVTDVHGFIFRHQAPLQTGGKARAAAPFQTGVFTADDFIRRRKVSALRAPS